MQRVTRVSALLLVLALAGSATATWVISGDNMYADVEGNVGIGTIDPDEKLTVAEDVFTLPRLLTEPITEPIRDQDSTICGRLVWQLRLPSGPPDPLLFSSGYLGRCIREYYPGTAGSVEVTHRIMGVYGESDAGAYESYGGYFTAKGDNGVGVYAKGGSDGCAGMFDGDVIISTGRTITPVLEITGGSDVSEQFDIQGTSSGVDPAPGMVVSIDPDRPGDLVISSQAYDRKVAGIISGAGGVKPGMLMGQSGTKADGRNPVALTGRVYCRADASYGPIEPGDLLTTSDTPGHAMSVTKYNRAQGAILGKAMSALESGRGLVLVLVTLQ